MQMIEVKLSQLKIDPANVRKTSLEPEPEFLASIKKKGVIHPLIVRPNGDGFLVTDGGKRLTSLQQLAKRKEGNVSDETLVSCILRQDDEGDARDISLTSNFVRSEMHSVDEFEAFVQLQADGKSIDDICKGYGIKKAEADRILALGALAPAVRAAWREGKIDQETASAFTIEPDLKRQEKVLKSLGGHLNRYRIREQLTGGQSDTARYLTFVGREAYEAAGGRVIEDLFAQRNERASFASDQTLLKKLADEKLEAECQKLLDDGWSWAEVDSGHERHTFDTLNIGGYKPVAKDKMRSGCFVVLDYQGKLSIEKWYVRGKAAAAAAKASKTKEEKPKAPTTLSGALKGRLEAQLLKATQSALLEDTKGSDLAATLGKIVASQILADRPSHIPKSVRDKLGDVRAHIAPKTILASVLKEFDAKDYFSSAPKGIVRAAIKEAGFTEDQAKLAKATKADTWKFAVANVPKTGWLPKELRGPYYVGPTVTSKAPAKTKRKAA